MFDYLQKFNKLPKDLRDKVSTPEVMKVIEELENKYGIDLASVAMKVMVKEIDYDNLVMYLVSEFNMADTMATTLTQELKEKVFKSVSDYLAKEKISIDKEPDVLPQLKLTPEGPIEEIKTSDFYFAPEDEEEIRVLARKIQDEIKPRLPDVNIKAKLDDIVRQTKINFSSSELIDRFKQILASFLRGIRDKIETRLALTKSIEQGGLGLDRDSAEKVLSIAESISLTKSKEEVIKPSAIKVLEDELKKVPSPVTGQTIAKPVKQKVDQEKLSTLLKTGARDIEYDLAKELKKKDIGKEKKPLDVSHEIAPPPPRLVKPRPASLPASPRGESQGGPASPGQGGRTSTPLPDLPTTLPVKRTDEIKEVIGKSVITPDKLTVKLEGKAPKSQAVTPTISLRRASIAEGKVKIEDVKVPRIVTPIEELKYLELVNFRRLSKDAVEAVNKIKEKINFLEEEKYSKRLEGIKAWRMSPVNKLYLDIGQASIAKKKPISVIIEERIKAGEKYLSNQEFKAVMDLNRSLRF